MVKSYFALIELRERLTSAGMHDLDPVVRSITRKLWKLEKVATDSEREQMDAFAALDDRFYL